MSPKPLSLRFLRRPSVPTWSSLCTLTCARTSANRTQCPPRLGTRPALSPGAPAVRLLGSLASGEEGHTDLARPPLEMYVVPNKTHFISGFEPKYLVYYSITLHIFCGFLWKSTVDS